MPTPLYICVNALFLLTTAVEPVAFRSWTKRQVPGNRGKLTSSRIVPTWPWVHNRVFAGARSRRTTFEEEQSSRHALIFQS